jgi:hypothetical protein
MARGLIETTGCKFDHGFFLVTIQPINEKSGLVGQLLGKIVNGDFLG